MPRRIVLASNNAGKLTELNAIFAPYQLELVNQGQLDVSEAEETGLSFVENAILKARHAAQLTGLPSIADDSGLEVIALGGKPGIYSARFSGEGATDEKNNALLVDMMQTIAAEERRARFRCAMVYMRHHNDPVPIIAEGIFEGEITTSPRGENGFGYDPLFYLPALDKTCAELDPDTKNTISHRALATQKLVKKLIANQIIKP